MKTIRKHIFKTILLVLVSSLVLVMCGDNNVGVRTYVVTFSANGGNGSVPDPQTVQAGSSILLPSKGDLSRSGFEFGGWNTDADGRGSNYNGGVSFTPTSHITLYARWYRVFTVTFDANGGRGTVPSPQTVLEGTSITLPGGNTLSKTGYDFLGWNTKASGSGTSYKAGSSFKPTADITLYAEWGLITVEAPEYINATAISSSSIRISWDDVDYAIGYYVYRSSTVDGAFSIVASTVDTLYTDIGLLPNTTYYYRVSAVSSTYKESQLSSYASATTLGNTQ